MSSAIRELHLEAPPVTLDRLGNVNVTMWRGRCECGVTSRVQPRIGLVMDEIRMHSALHRLQTKEPAA